MHNGAFSDLSTELLLLLIVVLGVVALVRVFVPTALLKN